jgi:hypothetical protein
MWQSEQASELQMVGRISSGQIKILSFIIGILKDNGLSTFYSTSLSKLVVRSNFVLDVAMSCIALTSLLLIQLTDKIFSRWFFPAVYATTAIDFCMLSNKKNIDCNVTQSSPMTRNLIPSAKARVTESPFGRTFRIVKIFAA